MDAIFINDRAAERIRKVIARFRSVESAEVKPRKSRGAILGYVVHVVNRDLSAYTLSNEGLAVIEQAEAAEAVDQSSQMRRAYETNRRKLLGELHTNGC